MANFISSNTYDPTHVDTSAKWRPEVATFPYSNASDFEEESESEGTKAENKAKEAHLRRLETKR